MILYTCLSIIRGCENCFPSLDRHIKLEREATDPDYYQVLAITRDASAADIKGAYRRALLKFHPDKRQAKQAASALAVDVPISLIREAYATLSLVETRKRYDALLLSCTLHGACGAAGVSRSRPAQLVSLEEFSRRDGEKPMISGGVMKDQGDEVGSSDPTYTYPCRCGGMYQLTTDDLENGHHLVGCEGCSEVIWVGYEEIDEGEGVGDAGKKVA